MGDVRTKLIWSLQDNVSAGTAKLKNELNGIGITGKNATSVMGKMSLATGGLVTPQTLAAAGALALAGAIAGSVKAAIDEEKNIARLGASLKANIPNWDGNTDAIERQIKQREKLAFSDDDLRESLGLLVAATHDVGEAQNIQATAMDLARFKNVSLKEATEALIKIEGGRFRGLANLGIELRKGATQTEALAAVQEVAAGSAKAYGETTAGAMEAAAIAVQDLQENIGQDLMPVVKDLANWLSDELIPRIERLSDLVGDNNLFGAMQQANEENLQTIRELNPEYEDLSTHLLAVNKAAYESTRITKDLGAGAKTAASGMDRLTTDTKKTKDELQRLKDLARNALDPLLEDLYGPAILAGKEAGILQDIKATKKALEEAKKAGDQLEITRLRGELAQERSDLASTRADMDAQGNKPAHDHMTKWVSGLITKWDRLGDEAHDAVYWAQRFASLNSSRAGDPKTPVPGSNVPRASGGPVVPGGVYRVGEYSEEQLVMYPGGGGEIRSGSGTGRRSGGGGNAGGDPVVIQLMLDGRTVARVVSPHLYYDLQAAVRTRLRT